jgi:hypothetical protein
MFGSPVNVDLGPDADDADVNAIAHLRTITTLTCRSAKVHGSAIGSFTQLSRLEIHALADEPDPWGFLRRLRALNDLQVWHDEAHVPPISDSTLDSIGLLRGLRSLHIRQPYLAHSAISRITAPGVAKLAGIQRLESLWLNGVPLGHGSIAEIAHLRALDDLWLEYTGIDDEACKPLGNLEGLKSLNLEHTFVGDDAMRYVATLAKLHTIYLCDTKVTRAGVEMLARLPRLERLILSASAFSVEDQMRLGEALRHVRSLQFVGR